MDERSSWAWQQPTATCPHVLAGAGDRVARMHCTQLLLLPAVYIRRRRVTLPVKPWKHVRQECGAGHVTSEHVLQGSFLTEKRERKHSSNTRAAFACTPCFSSTCNAMQVRQLRTSQESAQWYRTSPLIDQLYSTGTDPQCMGVPWHPGLIR